MKTKSGDNRLRRSGRAGRDPGLGTMLAASLMLHLLVGMIFGGYLVPHRSRPKPPAYMVDLVNLPVARPQAGRPDGRVEKKTTKKPVKKVTAKPKPKPRPKPKPKPAAKKVVKKVVPKAPVAKPKPAQQKPKARPVRQQDYRQVESAIDKLRRAQERERLKQQLAALAAKDTRRAANEAPLGEEKGTGDQQGVGYRLWLRQAYKQAWALSPYQVGGLDLETTVEVVYDARGYLRDYTVKKESGDRLFDSSVTRAIRSVDRLEPPPGHEIRETIVFNLKELQR